MSVSESRIDEYDPNPYKMKFFFSISNCSVIYSPYKLPRNSEKIQYQLGLSINEFFCQSELNSSDGKESMMSPIIVSTHAMDVYVGNPHRVVPQEKVPSPSFLFESGLIFFVANDCKTERCNPS